MFIFYIFGSTSTIAGEVVTKLVDSTHAHAKANIRKASKRDFNRKIEKIIKHFHCLKINN